MLCNGPITKLWAECWCNSRHPAVRRLDNIPWANSSNHYEVTLAVYVLPCRAGLACCPWEGYRNSQELLGAGAFTLGTCSIERTLNSLETSLQLGVAASTSTISW